MKIFISRNLDDNSIFSDLLSQHAEIIDRSLINFEAIPLPDALKQQVLFFYSKNSIDFYFDQYESRKDQLYAVMGSASAKHLFKKIQREADFIGVQDLSDTAAAFNAFAQDRTVCFVGANHSNDTIRKLSGGAENYDFTAVYNNDPIKNIEIESCDIYVFTSPMNVRTFFENNSTKDKMVISIGPSTVQALNEFGLKNITLSEEPSERHLALCCLKIIEDEI